MSFKHDRQRKKVMMELTRRGSVPRVSTTPKKTEEQDEESDEEDLESDEED